MPPEDKLTPDELREISKIAKSVWRQDVCKHLEDVMELINKHDQSLQLHDEPLYRAITTWFREQRIWEERDIAPEDSPPWVSRNDPDFYDPRYQRRIMKLWRPIPIVENIHEVLLSCGHDPLLLGGNPTPEVGMYVFCGDCRDKEKVKEGHTHAG